MYLEFHIIKWSLVNFRFMQAVLKTDYFFPYSNDPFTMLIVWPLVLGGLWNKLIIKSFYCILKVTGKLLKPRDSVRSVKMDILKTRLKIWEIKANGSNTNCSLEVYTSMKTPFFQILPFTFDFFQVVKYQSIVQKRRELVHWLKDFHQPQDVVEDK